MWTPVNPMCCEEKGVELVAGRELNAKIKRGKNKSSFTFLLLFSNQTIYSQSTIAACKYFKLVSARRIWCFILGRTKKNYFWGFSALLSSQNCTRELVRNLAVHKDNMDSKEPAPSCSVGILTSGCKIKKLSPVHFHTWWWGEGNPKV